MAALVTGACTAKLGGFIPTPALRLQSMTMLVYSVFKLYDDLVMSAAKIIYGTAWCVLVHMCSFIPIIILDTRKKERTTALVISAVLHGFQAIDTGMLNATDTLRHICHIPSV